jgi:hypothetical protein
MLGTVANSPLFRHNDNGRFKLPNQGLAAEISSTCIGEEGGGKPGYLLPETKVIIKCISYTWGWSGDGKKHLYCEAL